MSQGRSTRRSKPRKLDNYKIRGARTFKKYLEKELSCIAFNNHCQETARALNISEEVVRDVLMHLSLKTLVKLEEGVIKKRRIKTLVTGVFSFQIKSINQLNINNNVKSTFNK